MNELPKTFQTPTMAPFCKDEEKYKVVDQINDVEIRFYPSAPMIKVSSNQSRNNNFGKLFRYIAGNNKSDQKIAMTTPVYMSDNNKTMEFVLPKNSSLVNCLFQKMVMLKHTFLNLNILLLLNILAFQIIEKKRITEKN